MEKVEGIIVVYKEKGLTSHDVVDKVRRLVGTKKVGHTGTLDPDAEGILPICIGNATKVVEYVTEKDKEYIAEMTFGLVTDTQDISGKVLSQIDEFVLDEEEARKVINSYVGDYLQTPPIYSAVKVKGKKLYEYARSGETVKIPPRKVEIKEIEILGIEGKKARIRVVCTKGTYIRTLCHDIGKKLRVGACMSELLRTKSGTFTLDRALKLSQIEEEINKGTLNDFVLDLDTVFSEYPKCRVKEEAFKKLENGNKLLLSDVDIYNAGEILETVYATYYEEKFYALYKGIEEDGEIKLKIEKMFVRGE